LDQQAHQSTGDKGPENFSNLPAGGSGSGSDNPAETKVPSNTPDKETPNASTSAPTPAPGTVAPEEAKAKGSSSAKKLFGAQPPPPAKKPRKE